MATTPKSIVVGARLSGGLHREVKKICGYERRKVSEIIRFALEKYATDWKLGDAK